METDELLEKVYETITPLVSQTRTEAFLFQHEEQYYHISIYQVPRMGKQTSIWNANKKGKRLEKDSIFSMYTPNIRTSIKAFIEQKLNNLK